MGKRKSYKKKKRDIILISDKNLFFDGSYMPNNSQMAGLDAETWGVTLPDQINLSPQVQQQVSNVNTQAAKNSLLNAKVGQIGQGIQKAGAVAGAVGSMVDTFKKNSALQGVEEKEQEIENVKTAADNLKNTSYGDTRESVLSSFNNLEEIDSINKTSFKSLNGNMFNKALNTLGSSASGASAGMSVGGPWGALIGGIVGAAAGTAGTITGLFKANKKKKELNAEIARANREAKKAMETARGNASLAMDNINQNEVDNAFLNYAAFGGLFNTFNDGGYTGPMYVDPNQVNTRQSFLSTAPTRGQRVKNRLNMIGDAVTAFLPSKEETATNIATSRFMPKVSGKLGVISMTNNLPDTVSKIENLKKAFNLPYSEGLIDAGKGQTFIGSAAKKFAKGGDTEEEIILPQPEDPDANIVPIDIVEVAPKPFAPSPTIVEHTESNKLLPNEATPRNFLIGTNDEGEESQRFKIYKENLKQFLGREVSDEEAKKKLEEGVARMEAAPASVIQYSNMFKMPWHATLTTADKLSPYTVSREATREGDKGNDGYFTSLNYENLTQNPEELIDNKYIKPGHIGYLQIEPGSPEWETLTAHERAHAMMLKAAEATIAGRNIKPVSGEYDPDYWDDAKEIYARVKSMQVSEKMDPNKEYSAKEIRDILKNKKDKYKLDRYSDDDLEFIFNKVAYNPSNLNIEVPEQMKYTNPSEGVSLAAYGGPLFKEFSNGITIINEGGTHEDNPFEGVQVGVDSQGTPNLVEEGEVIFNDYVFSNRLTVPNKVRSKYKLRNNKKLSFADAAKDIQKMSEEMPNDPIVKRTMELRMNQLMQEQEMIRQKKNEHSGNTFAKGGSKEKFDKASKRASKRFGIDLGEYTKDWQNSDAYKDYLSANKVRNSNLTGLGLQAAPALGSLLAVGNDIFGGNKADLSTVDAYRTAIDNAYKPVGTVKAHTISDYMQYNPYDTSFELNKLNASQAASRNALINTSGGNSAAARAAILASDYNYGNQIGDTYRRAQEYNDANREKVMAFNRGTNQFNAQALDSADARNAQIAQFNAQQDNARAEALFNAGKYRDALIQANRAEKSGNLTGLYEGLAGLGETIYNMGNVKYLQDNKVLVDETGNIKGGTPTNAPTTTSSVDAPIYYTEGDPASERAYLEARKAAGYINSKGGKLKRKTKRRRLS